MNQFVIKSKLGSYKMPNISVGQYFKQNIDRITMKNQEKIALINSTNGYQISYKDLHSQTLEISAGFISQLPSLNPHLDLCMFFGDNSLQYTTLILAMAYIGLPVTPAAPANGAYEIVQQLSDSNASILCVSASRLSVIKQIAGNDEQRKFISRLKMLVLMDCDKIENGFLENVNVKVITYQDLQKSGKGQNLPQIPYFPVNPQNDAYVIVYTSGSTGQPKGAIHTHRSFLAAIYAMQKSKIFVDNFAATVSAIYPFGHISGTILLANSFASEMTSVLFERPDKVAIFEAVERYKITFLIMFLTLSVDMVANDYTKKYNLSSLKVMFFSGIKIPVNISRGLTDRYNVLVHELYGSTELMGGCSNMGDYELGNVGEPLPNVEMKIVRINSGESLPSREEGEIYLRAPNCFVGYLNNPKATQETIDSDGWYHTGDVGYYNERGCLFITDRIKELIKYKHWSISPAEIEAFLQTHKAISGSCVVGVKHATEGAHLRAFVQLETKFIGRVTEEEVVQYVKDNMGYQKRLNGGVKFIPLIPRSIIGKVDRQYFKNLVKEEVILVETVDE